MNSIIEIIIMNTDNNKLKSFKASDFINMQQRHAEKKSLSLENENNRSIDEDNNEQKVDSAELSDDINDVEAEKKIRFQKSMNFYCDLEKTLKESRDRKFIDNKIRELDFYKELTRNLMLKDCSGNSYKTAKGFLQSIEQAQTLLERLWKFYA
jgi:hypothetical protein